MAREPKDHKAQAQAYREMSKKADAAHITLIGKLVIQAGGDDLSNNALAGMLITSLEQLKKQPDLVEEWTRRGQTFLQKGAKRGKKLAGGDAAPGAGEGTGPAPQSDRAAE